MGIPLPIMGPMGPMGPMWPMGAPMGHMGPMGPMGPMMGKGMPMGMPMAPKGPPTLGGYLPTQPSDGQASANSQAAGLKGGKATPCRGAMMSPNAPAYKTTMCRYFEIGQCARGASCSYAHGTNELRVALTAAQQNAGGVKRSFSEAFR
mmetsp:Transcript_71924/g.114067  ORF Transcript_71924/g.114067 Transcript_71924/m.114067 type:complete len:149 (-) Transcript_71924:22-468(-)